MDQTQTETRSIETHVDDVVGRLMASLESIPDEEYREALVWLGGVSGTVELSDHADLSEGSEEICHQAMDWLMDEPDCIIEAAIMALYDEWTGRIQQFEAEIRDLRGRA